jgi:hypothetical protein
MARAKTSGRDHKADEPPPLPDITIGDITVNSTISRLEAARIEAMDRGHTAQAVIAILEMAKLKGLYNDKSDQGRAVLPKFDGNYHEAARRIALLLRLGKEKPAKAGKKGMTRKNGHNP